MNGFIVSLNRLDAGKVSDSVDKRYSRREVARGAALASNSSRELQPRNRFCSLSHDPVPIRNGYSLLKYLPICFDVKYFDIK
jgi:hypothetical protein